MQNTQFQLTFRDKVKDHADARDLFEKFLWEEWWEMSRQNYFKNGVNRFKLSYEFEYYVRFNSWGIRPPEPELFEPLEKGKDFNRDEIEAGGIWQDQFEKS